MEIKDRLDKEKSLLILSESEGGKELMESLKGDVDNLINRLTRDYEVVEHIALVTLIAKLEAKKDLLELLARAKENVKILTEEYENEEKNKRSQRSQRS